MERTCQNLQIKVQTKHLSSRSASHLQLLQLLQDHVVRHVVEEAVGGGEDDVAQLDVEGGAVCRVRAAGTDRETDRW